MPFFIITKDMMHWQSLFKKASFRFKHQTSHFQIFSSMLILASYDKKDVYIFHAPSLSEPPESHQSFISSCCLFPKKLSRSFTPLCLWIELNLQPKS